MSINADWFGGPDSTTGAETERPGVPSSGLDDDPVNGASASQAAARLLELTARETEQWRAAAESEAAAIVAGAREESAGLVRAAREEAERLVSRARDEAAQVSNEARVEAYRVREETTALRKRHDDDVARLREVTTEHQERLRHHLTEMLDQVDSLGESGR